MHMQSKLITALVLIAGAAVMRLVPHIPNFTPLAAIALLGGSRISQKSLAYLIPVAALFLSDAILGFYGRDMVPVYASFLFTVFLGTRIQASTTWTNTMGMSLVSSIVFFAITNLVFLNAHSLYPYNVNGMIQSYIAGIPFFGYSVLGDLFYNSIFYFGFEWIQKRILNRAV